MVRALLKRIYSGRRRGRAVLAFGLGAVNVLGFAPFNAYVLPVVALAAFFWLLGRDSTWRSGALTGFAFGLGYFGAGVSWVYVSLHDFGDMPLPLAALATLLFCSFLALFPAAVGALQTLHHSSPRSRHLLLMPALWVAMEWIRGWIFTGFPWLAIGYSQAPNGLLAGYAPLFGVFGISLLVAISAGILAWVFSRMGHAPMGKLGWLGALVVLWAGGWWLKQVEWTQPTGAPFTVSLLQGNIPQDIKWREDKVDETLAIYRNLALASKSRLIVIPETAIPLFYHDVPQPYLKLLEWGARNNGGDILIGLPERGQGRDYYNSVFSLGSGPIQTYRKRHLVPFGEYVPLRPIFGPVVDALSIPLTDFARGEKRQPPIEAAGEHVGVNICYEDAFGEEIIRQLPRVTVLVNVSNDAWFGDSFASVQHLQISQMRALETGRYMLRATNTGMTAIIDQHGRVVQVLAPFTRASLDGMARGFSGATPYVLWGNGATLAAIALMLGLGWLLGAKGR
jgi:apolipoprotein N-acyltransferase